MLLEERKQREAVSQKGMLVFRLSPSLSFIPSLPPYILDKLIREGSDRVRVLGDRTSANDDLPHLLHRLNHGGGDLGGGEGGREGGS